MPATARQGRPAHPHALCDGADLDQGRQDRDVHPERLPLLGPHRLRLQVRRRRAVATTRASACAGRWATRTSCSCATTASSSRDRLSPRPTTTSTTSNARRRAGAGDADRPGAAQYRRGDGRTYGEQIAGEAQQAFLYFELLKCILDRDEAGWKSSTAEEETTRHRTRSLVGLLAHTTSRRRPRRRVRDWAAGRSSASSRSRRTKHSQDQGCRAAQLRGRGRGANCAARSWSA